MVPERPFVRPMLLVSLLAGLLPIGASPAAAHSHFVVLPDGECAWLAAGGSEGAAHEDVHPLHDMLHVGTAGDAMDHDRNPVDVDKDTNAGDRCSSFKN